MNPDFEILVGAGAAVTQRSTGNIEQLVEQIKRARGGTEAGRPIRSYSQVSAVYACVKARSDALSMMPLRISTGEEQVMESGPLVQLAERPNPRMTGRAFRRMTEALLLLFGRVHWVMTLAPGGVPISVFPVSPMQMEPKLAKGTGELLGWKYRPAGAMRGQAVELSLEEVHTIIDPDFEDADHPLEGLSPRRAATLAISQYFKADLANESSLDNGCEPGLILTMEGTPSDPQLKDLRETLRERHGGAAKRNREMLLHSGMDAKTIARAFGEMEFKDLKAMSRTDICAAFSVPPAVVGFYEDSNYAHAESAEQGFWIKTMIPRASWIAEEWDLAILTRYNADRSLAMAEARHRPMEVRHMRAVGFIRARDAARYNGRRFYSWFDSSCIPAVQKALLSLADQAQKWSAIGVPLNALSSAFYLPFEDYEWGDTWYKPIGQVDVREDAMPGSTDPAGDDIDAEDRSTVRSPAATVRAPNEATRARLWLAWRGSWSGLERAVRGKLLSHFEKLRSQVLARLAEEKPAGDAREADGIVRRDMIGRVLFDLQPANQSLVARVGPLLRESVRLGGEQAVREAADARGSDKADPFNLADPEVARKLRARQIKITRVNHTLRTKLAETLADGASKQETAAELAERVRREFGFAANRAGTIARTEVAAAVEEARQDGRRQAGTPLKSWLWSRKETGRPSHGATETATMQSPIPNSQPFTIAGTSVTCQHPRSTGLPEHDVNCSCTTLARYPDDTIKAVLDRYTARGFLTYEHLKQLDQKTGGGHA